ncbi:PIN domain-containing protein [Vibrio sp. SCSIO 43136]|uniref:PIN-like domain-containing protein n=1 Tax=Vibrio sp. SCSIO 43136 TaxID=2819101 RepID=UPI002074E077|nr:PIN domain-containing protein [Vibrio sp. SCSIO 43136]USD68118.1 DUF4935 domain-containing protein [Vibrio sp. SCSIO 43136]
MKNMFRSFKKLNDEELKELWEKAVFVFDTNVLHGVYRYQSSTCQEVLDLMERLKDRIWIPHHVVLEYHRNRQAVINGQHNKFSETKKAVKKAVHTLTEDLAKLQLKKRHSQINPDPLLDGIEKLTKEYFEELDVQEKTCLKVESEDHLLERISNLLDSRVGKPPEDKDIADIMNEGKKRYAAKLPPGYKDANKEKEADNKYSYGGVAYERQYGDLIVWKQLIAYAKETNKTHLIFVTDDNKEDWWQIVQGKTVGFRSELLDEVYTETDLEVFNAYSLGSFLANAKQFLPESKAVSDDAIVEVKEAADLINYNPNMGDEVPSCDHFISNNSRLEWNQVVSNALEKYWASKRTLSYESPAAKELRRDLVKNSLLTDDAITNIKNLNEQQNIRHQRNLRDAIDSLRYYCDDFDTDLNEDLDSDSDKD